MTQFFVPPGQPPAGTLPPGPIIDPEATKILDASAQLRLMREQNAALFSGTPTPNPERGLLPIQDRIRLAMGTGMQTFF